MTLVWRCDQCGDPVADGDGFVGVSFLALAAYRRAEEAWDLEHRVDDRLNVFTFGQLAAFPTRVAWQVVHTSCDPNPDEPGYWINVERIRSAAALIHWAAHLGDKKWIADSNWTDVLHRHADELRWAA